MKPRNFFFSAATFALLAFAPMTHADVFNFQIDLNVAALVAAPNGPFFLDFQLNQGSGSLINSVTLSGFTFTNGGVSESASLFGNATGSMAGSVNLFTSAGSPFNEFFQGFSAGTTNIHFNISITENSPGATPDQFTLAILNSQAGNPQIGTNAPDGVSLLTLPITNLMTLANVATFSSTSPGGVTATASVPEPSAFFAFLTGLVVLVGFRWRRAPGR
jgi:hypothetical protein